MCLSVSVGVFVFPDICGHHNSRTYRWIVMIFGMWVGVGKVKVKVNIGLLCDLGTAAELFLYLLTWTCYGLDF